MSTGRPADARARRPVDPGQRPVDRRRPRRAARPDAGRRTPPPRPPARRGRPRGARAAPPAARGRGRPAKVVRDHRGRPRRTSTSSTTTSPSRRCASSSETGGDEAVLRVRPPPRRVHRARLRRGRRRPPRARRRPRRWPGSSPSEGYAASVRSLPLLDRLARASSCASSTARSPTSPTSSRSCARPRPRPSARSSAATCSAWPPSPTATGSAPPASRTATSDPTRPSRQARPKERSSMTSIEELNPELQGHRPLPVRLGRPRRRRRDRQARPQRGRRPRHLREEVRAAVDARPAPEGPQALRPQAHAHLGLRPVGHRLRQHQVLRALQREAGRLVGGPPRGHQEHLRQARHPRGGEAAPRRRCRRAVRVRGRLPLDPRGPRGAGRHLPGHRHRAARSTRSSSRSTSAP